ncbi:hypothetical protein LTR10_020583 [Elasticomyces elasticus]|uniref:Uncharacterized protein n=1 Tax=Exophiala sideris TaxID=1016849 RepID=A0ABR0JL20_9EURO|nr:hypothetical protein LTR10_020583 [Elasticomyces elasticus]KAK5035437.1 hypothetical protein LTS07_002875 [Exophiala sideris]KAK5039211.1 hypothetical protein LTR13_003467 [Exophiala sideris]KAK5066362.1 hypothetical protein LTR69_002881 [Exophiala sideris]KAK5187039.1 hypothetical protein LTR44_001046 [Eurotiomycetes sp. CCFEE 6388]
MSPAQIPRAPSPLRIGSGWRDGMTRIMRPSQPSQERQHTAPEISRWSKTTTDTEVSEAPKEQLTKKMNVLKKRIRQNRQSKDTTKSSPVDPAYDPVAKKFLPAAITASDGPQTFYDSSSDDSSEAEPVIHRASSVRVARPQIVEHSNGSGGSVPKLYPPRSSSTETEQPQSSNPAAAAEAGKSAITGGPTDALKALEGQGVDNEPVTALPQIPTDASTEQDPTLKQTILEWPDTPSKLEALDTLPTPMGGFGSLRMPRTATGTTSSSGTYVPSVTIDGLRSNPPTESDKKLSRAISAPVRNSASRRVIIRPSDLVINRNSNNHKLFRENIVSTPYPARKTSIGDNNIPAPVQETKPSSPKNKSLRRARPLHKHDNTHNEKSSKGAEAPEIPLSTKPTITPALSSAKSKSDRFPSPVAPEVLFLDLRLARHPSARVQIEIEVTDKTTFDDEQLFTLIRASYNKQLLGVARRVFSARSLSHASLSTTKEADLAFAPLYLQGSISAGEIDGADFIKHLLHPRCGRRRKMWLLWLRNMQYHESSIAMSGRSRRMAISMASGSNGSPESPSLSPVFSFVQTTGHSSHSRSGSESSPVSVSAGAPSSGSSIRIPRMPFQPFRSTRSRGSMGVSASGPPAVYLHYTFSMRKIVGLLLLTFFLAIFTATMWILFGVPGRNADQGNGTTIIGGEPYTLSWKRDAQSRVGVGLVMGIVVLGLGLVSEAVWVWASWILV